MPVVIDTNVWISGLLWKGSPPSQIIDRVIDGRLIPVFAFSTWAELENSLIRVAVNLGRGGEVRQFLEDLRQISHFVAIDVVPDACRDPRDNQLLAVAASAEAGYLVSGDEDLLVLGQYGRVMVLSPADFQKLPALRRP